MRTSVPSTAIPSNGPGLGLGLGLELGSGLGLGLGLALGISGFCPRLPDPVPQGLLTLCPRAY